VKWCNDDIAPHNLKLSAKWGVRSASRLVRFAPKESIPVPSGWMRRVAGLYASERRYTD